MRFAPIPSSDFLQTFQNYDSNLPNYRATLAKVGQISNFCWDAISEGQNSHLRVEMRRVDDAC